MDYLLLMLPILLPVAFWSAYHLHVDRHLREPALHLLLAFVLGVAAFYLGLMGYRALDMIGLRFDAFALARDNLPGLFSYAVLAIGPIEELAKLLPFLLVVLRFRDFNEPLDGIVYASFIALGFAAVENMLYVPYLDSAAAYARGFIGPVLHIVFASIWGYYIGRAWLCRRSLLLHRPRLAVPPFAAAPHFRVAGRGIGSARLLQFRGDRAAWLRAADGGGADHRIVAVAAAADPRSA